MPRGRESENHRIVESLRLEKACPFGQFKFLSPPSFLCSELHKTSLLEGKGFQLSWLMFHACFCSRHICTTPSIIRFNFLTLGYPSRGETVGLGDLWRSLSAILLHCIPFYFVLFSTSWCNRGDRSIFQGKQPHPRALRCLSEQLSNCSGTQATSNHRKQ